MKKFFQVIMLVLLVSACTNDQKSAQGFLDRAHSLYENDQFDAAKRTLDSLKADYPKQLDVLKEGLQLMRRIEWSEQERNILFCDSMLVVKQAEADSMKKLFVFEKDPQYDETGKYIDKQQLIERNLKHSYIRSGVNEQGDMYLASVYYGSGRIRHQQLKVIAPDDTYGETAVIPEDGGANFSFQDLGMITEVVTYQNGKDNSVILFIYNHKDSRLKAELIGQKKYSFIISDGDKKSLVKTYDFSVVLSDIMRLNKEKEKAEARIAYLRSKL